MKNVLEVVDIIYDHLKSGTFVSSLTGGLYKHELPINNDKEAALINSLLINNRPVQVGVMNLNIYVPSLRIFINGIEDTQPDTVRMQYLTGLALDELKEVWDPAGNYNFSVKRHSIIKDDVGSFVNIKLYFYSINIK